MVLGATPTITVPIGDESAGSGNHSNAINTNNGRRDTAPSNDGGDNGDCTCTMNALGKSNINDNSGHYSCREDDNPQQPLLSTYLQQKVKIGPFSIRYENPLSTRPEPSGRYYEDDDDDDEEENMMDNLSIPLYIRHKLYCISMFCRRSFNFIIPPPRILLLSMYLMTTLATFWILDSIKEPTLATLVNGQLGKHQPRAKMFSFLVVILLALVMEGMVRWRRRHRITMQRRKLLLRQQYDQSNEKTTTNSRQQLLQDNNTELERSWRDRNLPSCARSDNDDFDIAEGGTGWKRMSIRSSSSMWNRFHWDKYYASNENFEQDDDNDEIGSASKIPTVVFYIVGSMYIHAFIAVAMALRQHPSFRLQRDTDSLIKIDSTSAAANASDDGWYFPALGYVLFALIESYGSVSITIFWAFANSHLTLDAAERHYGSTVALAQIGAIGGSTLVTIMGRRTKKDDIFPESKDLYSFGVSQDGATAMGGVGDAHITPMLIFLACVFVFIGMAFMFVYSWLFSKPMRSTTKHATVDDQMNIIQSNIFTDDRSYDADNGINRNLSSADDVATDYNICGDLLGGVNMILRHEYLQLVLAVSVLYEIALTCMHYEMNLIGLNRFGAGINAVGDDNKLLTGNGFTYIQFLGWYGQTVNILSLFLSFYAFPRLIKSYGLSITIRIFPTVLLFVTIFAFVLLPQNLPFLFVSLSICKALTYSVHDPAEEVLYMPTSDDAKFRAKFWIDVVGQRIAKALGSAINNYAGNVEGIIKYGSLPSVVASLALWLACYQVGNQFDQLVKCGKVVGLERTAIDDEHSRPDTLCEDNNDGHNSIIGTDDSEDDRNCLKS